MAFVDDKRGSTSSEDTILSSVFDADATWTSVDAPISPLSDYPDDLSECSEARREQHAIRTSQSIEISDAHFPEHAPHTPIGSSKLKAIPEVQPETPEHAIHPGLTHGLLTPPTTLTRSKREANQASIPSPTPTRARLGQDVDTHPSSKRTTRRNASQNALPSTPRRSGRTRRLPPQHSSPPKAPKKTQTGKVVPRPASLVVQLRLRSQDLAHLKGNQPMASSSFPSQKFLSKRKHDATAADESPDRAWAPEEPMSQRRRLEIAPTSFTQPTSFPPRTNGKCVSIDLPPIPGPHHTQITIDQLSRHSTQGASFTNTGTFQRLFDLQTPAFPHHALLQRQPQLTPYFPSSKPLNTRPSNSEQCHRGDLPKGAVIDDHLHSITKALLANRFTEIDDKPDPAFLPEVWAPTRMDLCETLHYFRAYKGGSQTNNGIAKAFMFASCDHPRDFTDESVIISRAGGGLDYDQDTGDFKATKDQNEPATLNALRNNMKQQNAVVVITAKSNPCMPSKVPYEYCVLDFFKPTNIWCEKSKGKRTWRFRFEKLNSQKPSWWQPKDASEIAPPGSLAPPVVQTCTKCHVESQQVYLQGWMCLQPTCKVFWKIIADAGLPVEPKDESLTYDPRFVKQRNQWGIEGHHYDLTSDTAQLSGHAIAGENCSRAHWSGVVCPSCGRCCARLSWTGWECPNANCHFIKDAPHTLIPATSIREPFDPLTTSYMWSRDSFVDSILLDVSLIHNYRIHRYTIPGIQGFVAHLFANKTIVEEPSGPNAMFEELQNVDIGLRRRHMNKGFHTRHFTVNYGMPYKFIAATASASIEGAANAIGQSRSRLNWAAKLVLAQYHGKTIDEISEEWKYKEFNEVLALGYLEEQRIKYHDDGETGLGPTIATLSLGSPGSMKIRMKAKYFSGVSKSKILTDAPPLLGCAKYDDRLAVQPELEALKALNNGSYKKRAEEVVKKLGLKSKDGKDFLDLVVGHGDIVIMHGAEIQKFCEHAVSHKGKLRFALTCRHIDPDSLAPEDKPNYEVKPDTGNYDGSKLPLPA